MKSLRVIIKILAVIIGIYLLGLLVFYAFYGDSQYTSPQDLEESQQGYFASLSTGQIFYRDQGLGEKIILLHGFGASSRNFEGLTEHLSENYRVYALDFPGFGLSSKQADDQNNFAGQVKTVIEFMDYQNINQAYLIGHSMGGAVAAQVAADYPERVNKLVLLDTAGFGQHQGPYQFLKYLVPPIDRLITRMFVFNNSFITKAVELAYYDNELVDKDIVQDYLLPTKTKRADRTYIQKIREGIVPDISEEFAQIQAPTLILWGREDAIVDSLILTELNNLIEGSQAYYIEASGHVPHEENTEATANLIEQFIASLL